MKRIISFLLGGFIGFSAVLYFILFPEPFNGNLQEYPEIDKELSKIGKADVVMDFKRNALFSYIEGDTEKAIKHLKYAKEALGNWHPLYLRGEMERELLQLMIEKMDNRGE